MEAWIKELVNGNTDYFLENVVESDDVFFFGKETFKRFYNSNLNLIKSLSEKEKIQKILELLVTSNMRNLVYVPREFLTKEMIKYVVIVRGNKIAYLNEDFRPEFLAMIVFDFYPACIHQHSLDSYITKDEWLKKVKVNSNYIKYIPEDYLNQDLCDDAIKKDPNLIKHIPKKYRTKSICLSAYNHNYRNIKYVLDEYKTKDMCWNVIKKDAK